MKAVAYIALIAGLWLITAWFLMLAVDIANDDWLPGLPPLGFETSLALATLWLIRALVAQLMAAIQKADAR